MPQLDVRKLVDVDAGPLGRVREDEDCDVGNCKTVPSNERGG